MIEEAIQTIRQLENVQIEYNFLEANKVVNNIANKVIDLEDLKIWENHPTFLPRKYTEVRAVEYPVPSLEPDKNGIWNCSLAGCGARVHGAQGPLGTELVRAHLKDHMADGSTGGGMNAKEKLDLVLDESRPYLPVR